MAISNQIKKTLLYYASWIFPSSTPLFYFLYEILEIDVWISYFAACIIAGTVFYPVYQWIFKEQLKLDEWIFKKQMMVDDCECKCKCKSRNKSKE